MAPYSLYSIFILTRAFKASIGTTKWIWCHLGCTLWLPARHLRSIWKDGCDSSHIQSLVVALPEWLTPPIFSPVPLFCELKVQRKYSSRTLHRENYSCTSRILSLPTPTVSNTVVLNIIFVLCSDFYWCFLECFLLCSVFNWCWCITCVTFDVLSFPAVPPPVCARLHHTVLLYFITSIVCSVFYCCLSATCMPSPCSLLLLL